MTHDEIVAQVKDYARMHQICTTMGAAMFKAATGLTVQIHHQKKRKTKPRKRAHRVDKETVCRVFS